MAAGVLRRRHLLGLTGSSLLVAACDRLLPSGPAASPAATDDRLDLIASKIVSGGVGVDRIPPIDAPEYLTGKDADEVSGDFLVDGLLTPDGTAYAFPRFITVWHEIVNDTISGEPVSVTYCPLTGSTVAFSGRTAARAATTFGTSGNLYNSNLVMYDRATASYWPQLLGLAVNGDRKGERLVELPWVVTTSYARWKARHPQTRVLSTNTGHLRAYGTWPYGDYDTSTTLIFPVEASDDRFHPKKVVIGVREDDDALAIPKKEFLARDPVAFELGGRPFVVFADSALVTLRVFRSTVAGRTLRFAKQESDVVDEQTRTRWTPEGLAAEGELAGRRLEQVNAFDVQWFAWFAFYPKTRVLT